jgi:molecular chaperone GrpE
MTMTTGPQQRPDDEESEPRVVIRDKRRIDPTTGALREPADHTTQASGPDAAAWSAEGAPQAGDSAEVEELRAQVAERTADMQRVSAEYANYRKRVDRDRALVVETATAAVLGSLVPVLDDLDRAEEHGDLVGPFKAVADQLQAVLAKLGLEGFGEVGDPFDPTIHEAVMHSASADVTEPTCVQVMRKGYRQGERLIRAAMVAVAEPSEPPAAAPPGESESTHND